MNLEAIIAALLHDLADAQDRANRVSAKLSLDYRKDSVLQYFPVPNALLEEADITLHFAVNSIEEGDTSDSGSGVATTAPPRVVMQDIATVIAPLVLAELSGRLAGNEQSDTRSIASQLRQQLWKTPIRTALTQNLTSFLYPVLTLYCLDTYDIDPAQETRAALQAALVATFGEDQDLARSIGHAEHWAQQISQSVIGAHLISALRGAAADRAVRADDGETPATIRISLGPDLGDIPENLIQTVRLQARLRNYKWVIEQQDPAQKDQLVPES